MTDEERYQRGQEIVRDVEREFSGRPMPEMVEEVRARVEKLVITDGGSYCSYLMKHVEAQPERVSEPVVTVPPRAFPDDFYYKPTIVAEPETAREIFNHADTRTRADAITQHWVLTPENFGARSHQDWGPRTSPLPGLMCQCGHPAEEHAPACVHLIEGCGCEGFLKVPGVVEGA